MPLPDHFRPPANEEVQWNSFHSNWATKIADRLGEIMPEEFRAHEHIKPGGGLEIDVVAAYEKPWVNDKGTPSDSEWQPPAGALGEITFPDQFEVIVFRNSGGKQIVGAIELVSPANKAGEENRRAFVSKVVSYLHEGINVLVVDVVTERHPNLHNEIVTGMRMPYDLLLPPGALLYAASYRPLIRDGKPKLESWVEAFDVGDPLPTLPLRLISNYFVPVELEATYTEACRRRKLIP
jgi:hypothetical protein